MQTTKCVRKFLYGLALLTLSSAKIVVAQSGAQAIVGARPAAMGQAYIAVADDGYAAFWNPAGLTQMQNQSLQSQWSDLYGLGIRNAYVGYTVPFTDRFSAAVDWLHIGFGDRDLSHSENRFALAAGFKLSELLSAGASIKYLRNSSALANLANPTDYSSSATGFGIDAGLLLGPVNGLRFGFTAQDIRSTKIKYENGISRTAYPTKLRWGIAYDLSSVLLLAAGFDHQIKGAADYNMAHVGAEFLLHRSLALRGGLQTDVNRTLGFHYAAGAGLRIKGGRVDYAYIMTPGLPATHRFSAGLEFSLSASAVKIGDVDIEPLFPAYRMQYTRKSIGTAKLENTSEKPISAQVRLFIPSAMENPTELESEIVIAPGAETVDLMAVFDEKFNDWPKNRMVSAEIAIAYTDASRTRRSTKQLPVTIYKRNAMQWHDIGAAAGFVISDDESVSKFASDVLLSHADQIKAAPKAMRVFRRSMLLFDALSQHGIRYQLDANTPYIERSGERLVVDSIQYPAEFLEKRTGDCDDCTVLYCSLLENVGIPTALVDAPGHIFMAFDTGISVFDAESIGLTRDRYLVRNSNIWIPVEVTLFGEPFQKAWDTAMNEANQLLEEDRLIIVDTREAWQTYPPSPPEVETEVTVPSEMDLSPYFEAEDALIRNRQEMFLKENYFDDLEQDGENVGLRNDLVYCLVQLGRYDRAMSQLQILDDQKYNFAEIANSRALISVMTTQLGDAESYLLEGLERYPDNERCVANLTYVRYLLANRGGNLIDDSDDPNKAGVVELDARNIPWAK